MLDPRLLPLSEDHATLRPMTEADAAPYATGAGDPLVRRFAHLPRNDHTADSVRRMLAEEVQPGLDRGDLAVLTVADPRTDEFAGSLVLFDVRDDTAEVGFWIHPAARGQGYAAAALRLAVRFARASGLHHLRARTVPDNAASLRTLERAGFVRDGVVEEPTPAGEATRLVQLERSLGLFPLRTDRLTLRLHRPADRTWLQRIYGRADVARFLLDPPWTAADAERNIRERVEKTGLDSAAGALTLVIEHDGQPVGDVLVWWTDREHRLAEIGWVLDPAAAGRGYASEAAGAVLDLAFGYYRAHRVQAQMDARNDASARLAARLGMRREAHLRQNWWNKGEWTDTLIYARLAQDGV